MPGIPITCSKTAGSSAHHSSDHEQLCVHFYCFHVFTHRTTAAWMRLYTCQHLTRPLKRPGHYVEYRLRQSMQQTCYDHAMHMQCTCTPCNYSTRTRRVQSGPHAGECPTTRGRPPRDNTSPTGTRLRRCRSDVMSSLRNVPFERRPLEHSLRQLASTREHEGDSALRRCRSTPASAGTPSFRAPQCRP